MPAGKLLDVAQTGGYRAAELVGALRKTTQLAAGSGVEFGETTPKNGAYRQKTPVYYGVVDGRFWHH